MNRRSVFALLALVLCASPLHATCTFGFLTPSQYFANGNPGDVTTGDFNEDGYLDAIVVNRNISTSILLGTAGGGLGAPTLIGTDDTSGDIHAADFNNDGNLDFVVALPWSLNFVVSPHLKIYLGAGNGTFTPVAYTPQQIVYQNPTRVVLGDFNHDGLIDAATSKSGGWSSMQNLGGKLVQKAEYIPDASTTGIARGDFDDDGHDDIAVGERAPNKIHLFYGIGDGTFTAGTNTIDVPHEQQEPFDVQSGDFNGDGKDDLAILMRNPFSVASPLKIALSNGVARTFAAPIDSGIVDSGLDELVHDIDGDGNQDVLIANGFDGLLLFRGNGDGTLGTSEPFASGLAVGLAIGDFDRDGGDDVVVTDFSNSSHAVDVFLNTCGRVTLNLESSANPAPQGTPITITSTVVSPPAAAATGTLTLKRESTTLNSGNLTGGNVLTATMNDLTPATYTITAEYSGDSRFAPSTTTLSQVVTVPPFGPPPGFNAISVGGPVQLSWYATANTDHYEVWRNNGAGWAFVSDAPNAFFTDATAPASSALLYRVRAIAPGGAASDYSAVDLALTYAFESVDPGDKARLQDLTDLRSAANSVRALASLGAATWTSTTLIRAAHITELRTAIQQARTALGLPAPAFTETLTAGTTKIKALHFAEAASAMR